jgi:hypothetical protein
MRQTLARVAALALLAVALLARADVELSGFFHTGDEDNKTEFTPLDPVECNKYRSNPSTFDLTEAATITGVTLHNAIDLQNAVITVDIDGVQRSAVSCTACDLCEGTTSCGDVTIDLLPDVSLSAGVHTLAVIDPSGSSSNCLSSNDFGWSKMTLLSTATSTSVMLNQRRHIGDSIDSDDDYDTNDNANPFYPDSIDAAAVTQAFTLSTARRLTEVSLYKLRDLDVNDAGIEVDGTFLGNLADTDDPYEDNPTTVSTGFLLASGTHTVTVQTGNLAVTSLDDFSWDDIILRFAATTAAGTAGFFNAVDVGGNVLTGAIQTKIAGGAFTLDLYALDGFGAGQNTTYAGAATVEVLNASNSSGTTDAYGCNSSWSSAQSLGSVIFVGGKAQVSGTFLNAGLQEARIRVTDSATSASGCSIDNFAIRPASLSVAPSHATESTAGTTTALTNAATSGLPRHRAGAPFTIVATGVTAGGTAVSSYDGSPTAATPVVLAPATVAGSLTLGSWGAASGGARRTDTVTYSEVGAVTIALEDTSWANVDADDSAAAQRTVTGSVSTGRFVPDHFKVTDGTLSPACAADGFSYLGSALTWATAAVTLTAENALATPTTTQNYAGALETLPDTLAQPTYAAYDDPALAGTPTLNTTGIAVPTIGAASAGVATLTLPSLAFTRSLVAAFSAEIAVTLPTFADGDDIAPSESPIVIGSATAGGGIAFTGGAKSQRFGRLYFEPRYGSERLPMDVPLRAEYFDGVSFMPNTADAFCTTLTTGNVTLAALGGQTHVVNANGNGRWTVTLSAPNVSGQAGLSIDVAAPGATVPYPLLSADADGNGTYAEDPATTVTFGLHTQDDKRIYQREVVGN